MIAKADFTGHSAAARSRTSRAATTAVILHRLAADHDGDGLTTFEEAVRFFVHDPEGVATVALGGTYAEKRPTIAEWRRTGIPTTYAARGFVPYHFLVDAEGAVARMLPLDVRGAHAGAWNWCSVAVACLGRADLEAPPAAQVDACVELVRDIISVFPGARILGHDEASAMNGLDPKGCPGAHFPLEDVRARARAR